MKNQDWITSSKINGEDIVDTYSYLSILLNNHGNFQRAKERWSMPKGPLSSVSKN